MYIFKGNKEFKGKQKETAEIIGISESYFSKILNRKEKCSKVTAYAISKFLDSDSEINDFFEGVD